MFSKFTIRTRVGLIVIVSLLAIIGLSLTLLLQARERFMDQLRDGSVNQVQMIHKALSGLQSQVRNGQLTDAEAKRQGRFLINNTMVNERNYL
ncbi:MAG: cache domain-containing protein, partial [Pseudohongiella sp.]|nr:cache domain-containing protein [Pseudohongiella sp.]